MSKVSSQPQVNLSKIKTVRKGIAKCLTVITEKQRTAARDAHKKSRYTPKDLRRKATRSYRRRLTPFEASRMTDRAQKRADNYRLRKYAIAA